ncbi:O-methyltransferase [Nemorincola caseinilytica]|uniref:O-methyltransferase n=1 Tax=Nemorincola caseinilytica TaxID=2054315 RepID=A0ABP8NC42_9BACT
MTKALFPAAIIEYAGRFTSLESPTLAALDRETNMKRSDSVMLSGHLQGGILQMIAHMVRPSCILEIGTYTGYSAICLAQGLAEGGVLHTIDIDEELYDMAAKYIIKAGLRDNIVQHTGRAADIIPTLAGPFDLVFIDADKANYSHYYDLVFDKVPVGGYILADNVLYDGEVVLPLEQQGKNARAIHSFNQKLAADTRIERLLLPIRDGIMIARKIRG